MSCERCGSSSNGRLCASCEQMDRVERNHEHQKRSDGGAMAQPNSDADLDVPPAPEEVIDDERIQYQAMTELDAEEYARLADDIRENGVLQPVIVDDSPEQVIIDGHHREAIAQHYDLPKEKQPAYVVVGGADDDEKLSRAIKQNLIGRDTTEGVKSHAVRQYIELSWDRTDDGDLIRPETNQDVTEKLGVSNGLISEVCSKFNCEITTQQRVEARRYRKENPGASSREVARQVDASNKTVTKWLKEDFDEGDEDEDDDQPTLTATATDRNEAKKTADVFRRSQDDEDEDVREEDEENGKAEASNDSDDGGGDGGESAAEDASPELPDAEYDVVYADPPWRYNFSKTSNREIENQYETMSLTEIKALDVPAGDDAVLYLWATAPKLPEAVDVLEAWGFEYTTNLVWDKEKMGMGYWSRVQHEHLLIGTRGDVSPPATGERRRSVIREERGEHSSKPDTAAEMISSQHENADLIELFARDARDGWDSWGNEAPAEVADD